MPRDYDYKKKWEKLLTSDIVSSLMQIQEFKGQQALFIESKADVLTSLLKIAKIQSTEASNKIEGIYTSDARLKLIALDKTTPRSRDEQEIAGYRDVLNTIHENYDHIPITPHFILQLHRDLYKYVGIALGGKYKNSDNVIAEIQADGTKRVRFKPVEAWQTEEAMTQLCQAYNEIIQEGQASPLLITPMFVLDFLCIHPFNDGNGRMSRLLTLLLLYKAGYLVGKYISIENNIEKSKETYYESLEDSSIKWHENENNYAHFVKYMLGILLKAYRDFQGRVETLTIKNISKPERIAKIIEQTLGTITKAEILEKCPDISEITIQRALAEFTQSKCIIKIGGGRYTKYTWNRG